MANTRLKENLRRRREIRLWFWDGEREYNGEAVALSERQLTGLLKMSEFGDATVLPTRKLLENLSRYFKDRPVEFKISGLGLEANVRGRITLVQQDFEKSRRLLLEATFDETSEKNRSILGQLGRSLASPGPPPGP